MSKLIGIEGSSYVGKTTVASKLLEMGYGVIPEYDTFGPFPKSDGSVTGLKSIVDELLERERQRNELIVPDRVNFEDRTPISLITFEEMKILHADTSDEEKVHREVRNYTLSRIIQLSEMGRIILPDKIAVLRMTNHYEFEDRVKKRGVTAVAELALFATQLYVAQSALEHSRSLLDGSSSVTIDVDTKDPQTIARELINFVEQHI